MKPGAGLFAALALGCGAAPEPAERLDPLAVKGFAAPVLVYRMTVRPDAEARSPTPEA